MVYGATTKPLPANARIASGVAITASHCRAAGKSLAKVSVSPSASTTLAKCVPAVAARAGSAKAMLGAASSTRPASAPTVSYLARWVWPVAFWNAGALYMPTIVK